MNKKMKIILTTICFILVVCMFYPKSTSRLEKTVTLDYKVSSGNMICEYDIDNNESYIENGIKYFLVNVKNYNKLDDGTKDITDVDLNYTLTIQNKNNSNGVFKWTKVGSEDENEYSSISKTKVYSFNAGTEQTSTFKVYVKLNDEQKESQNVDIDIELNAEQVEKKNTLGSEK